MSDSVPVSEATSARGAARYVQERLLGQGAMGAVYLVRDRETGDQLALKKLFRMDGKSVLRLKREFRSLADLSHPNLVKLYELGRADDAWFLTMEYVAGEDLHAYLGIDAERSAVSRIDDAISALASRRVWLDETVVPAFHQLASGVRALHRAGLLHRDLKPNNVLVANQRVVVLDFGLVRELDTHAPSLTEDGAIAGTPAYMAPEQALGKPLAEASDWYAFGAMLYEVLTGELPIGGAVYELIRNKLERDPLPPEALNPDVPAQLSALCMALLARDPAARPSGAEVVSRLEPVRRPAVLQSQAMVSGEITILTETENPNAAAAFFGRQAELAALHEALLAVEHGRTVVARVHGMSGAGKTALVEQFLDEVEHQFAIGRQSPLVLRSRCYEREAMPFKALDGVIDALSRHLAHGNDLEVSNLLPTDIDALAQLFPVLERLRAVQHLLSMRPGKGDAIGVRQRAEAALRELFSRLAARRRVVIWIDDLQWGDLDSVGILKGWLQRSVSLPLLLLVSYRADEVETSECLRTFLAASSEEGASAATVQVSPLAREDVSALCRHQLGVRGPEHRALIERIVREAQGSPFLAAQLSALAEAKLTRGEADVDTIAISDLIDQHKTLLNDEERQVLNVLAVAGRPIAPKLALRAGGLRRGGREIVHALRRLQLVRTRDVAGERLLEVYHDRVRENVQRLLSPEQSVQIHGALLAALEYSGRADPDWLHTLALGADQRVAAFRYGLSAAERAMSTLAFERAAELYARCVELSDSPAEQRALLLRKLAEALDCGGHGSKAADAYLQAAALGTDSDALQAMRLGTSHLLRCGRFDEGETMLQRVFDAMGLAVPRSNASLMTSLIWEHVRAAWRGLRYTVRDAADIPPALLARIDAYAALRDETLAFDPLRAALFHARSFRLALDAGHAMGIMRGLSGRCHLESMAGTPRAERRTELLLQQCAALAERIATPAARATALATQAIVNFMLGHAQAVLEPAAEATSLFRSTADHADGSYYTRLAVASARIGALYSLSEYRMFANELQSALQELRATDNRAGLLHFALNECLLDELLDRPELAITRLETQRAQLPRGFGSYHALHLIAVCHVACTTREHAWGVRLLEQDWPRFLRSPMRRTPNLAALLYGGSARLLISHRATGGSSPLDSAINSHIRALARSPVQRAAASADVLRSRLAFMAGNTRLATELLARACEHSATVIDTERIRYALGELMTGERGAALQAQSERTLLESGVVNPVRRVRALFPELFPGTQT
jgi:hypothetical protein